MSHREQFVQQIAAEVYRSIESLPMDAMRKLMTTLEPNYDTADPLVHAVWVNRALGKYCYVCAEAFVAGFAAAWREE